MKKAISLALTGAMILSLLAGCSSSSTTTTSSTTGTTTSTTGTTTSTAVDTSGVVVGETFGTAENPVEVTIVMKDVSPSDEETQMYVAAVEAGMAEIGQYVKLTFIDPPSGTYSEATPIAFRTGQIEPDIIYFQGNDSTVASDGMLEDLTPYIAASTNVQYLMEPANEARMESYPYLLWLSPSRVNVPFINGNYEDYDSVQAVLADPSIDNYKAMFVDFMDAGITDFGFTSDGGINRLNSIFNQAFGVTGTYMMVDGSYVSSMITEEEKNKLEFYAELYAEGILDPDYITNAWDVMEDNFYSGKSLVMAGTGGITYVYNNSMVAANGDSAELTILPPATGVAQGYTVVDTTKEERGFAINADSDVKNEAFAVLEFMASPAGRIIDKLGIEGVHYNINADGTYETTDAYSGWWARCWDTWHNFPTDIEFVEYPISVPQQEALDAMAEYYVQDINIILPDELQPTYDALLSLYTEYSVDIITGARPISDFDEMVTKWYEYGGADIDAYVNANL